MLGDFWGCDPHTADTYRGLLGWWLEGLGCFLTVTMILCVCVCVLSISLCIYLHFYKAVCVCLSFRRWRFPQVGFPGLSCPFHHLVASAVSGGQARFLELFKPARPQQSPPTPFYVSLILR